MASSNTAAAKPRRGRPRGSNRRDALMTAAARLIAERGFEAASMREIAAAVDMLPGSVYYYFPSKEELFIAVHAEAVQRITQTVEASIEGLTDPWDRLEAACGAHLTSLIDAELVTLVSPDVAGSNSEVSERLIAQRDGYDRFFQSLIKDLPLGSDVDRRLFSLLLLGALNWTPTWYRKGRRSPAEIGRTFVRLLRNSTESSARQ